jgi:hypothetical protein
MLGDETSYPPHDLTLPHTRNHRLRRREYSKNKIQPNPPPGVERTGAGRQLQSSDPGSAMQAGGRAAPIAS